MSPRRTSLIGPVVLAGLTLSGTFLVFGGRARARLGNESAPALVPANVAALARVEQTPSRPRLRNLSLQPEAFRLSRRLGRRFGSSSRAVSVLVGTLIVGTEQQAVNMVRRQTERGERVEIAVGGGPALLTWSETEGPRSAGGRPTEAERTLIERLAFDTADQFVLAQLRGASYFTIARNARPANADDAYAGPLWDIVRIEDPQRDEEIGPRSTWRLYYVNSNTGLIDKVVCRLGGDGIEAEFSGWVDQNGERVPSQIVWTRNGQVIMQYRLTNFSHSQ